MFPIYTSWHILKIIMTSLLGRTTPEQTGHYSHYDTKLANVRYFHRTSCRIALTEPPSRPSCSRISRACCQPLCIWIKAIAWIVLNEGFTLTCWIWCMCPPTVQPMCCCFFNPRWAAVNDLNPVWSSTSLCGTPNLAMLLSINSIVPSMT